MLETITNFFTSISDFLTSLIDFLINQITGLLQVFRTIPSVISMFSRAIAFIPPSIAVFATLTITISVVYLVVGRDTGG